MTSLIRPFSVPGSASPLKVVRGQGSAVFDSEGRRYINAAAGLWNVTLGWGNEQLLNAIGEQLKKMAYATLFDDTHSPAERLAERLITLSKGAMSHVYLSTTGASAVEVAIRTAAMSHRAAGRSEKTKIVSYATGYHGGSWLSANASGLMNDDLDRWEFRPVGFDLIPSPTDEAATLAAIAALFDTQGKQIAALIVEPVLGSGGIVTPSRGYGERLTALCHEHGVTLIADEVATGAGRCGAIFASSLVGLSPDIFCLSKGLSAGYFPIGATLFADHVVRPLQQANVPLHFGSTQDGNPVGCVTALTALDIVEADGFLERVNAVGCYIVNGLLGAGGATGPVRALGLMIGVDLVHANGLRFSELEAARARRLCQEEGLLLYHYDGGLSMFPPLNITDEDANDILDILGGILSDLD